MACRSLAWAGPWPRSIGRSSSTSAARCACGCGSPRRAPGFRRVRTTACCARPAPTPPTCRERVEDLRRRLDGAEAIPPKLRRPPEGLRIPAATVGERIAPGEPPAPAAPVLVISADGDLSLDGRLIDGATPP